ncbi:MAG: hypothetical protein P9F75_19865 [Candidatus Contendobacter sp.]|nr:hypothetical protein [Candidatus Contendobacter sp.]
MTGGCDFERDIRFHRVGCIPKLVEAVVARRKGIEQGIEQGREQTLCELLEELPASRFGSLSEADAAQLSLWFRRTLTAPLLEQGLAGEE